MTFERLDPRQLAAQLGIDIRLLEDLGGLPGGAKNDTITVGETFWVEIAVQDIRNAGTPAGIIGLPLSLSYDPTVWQFIGDPDPTDSQNPLVTNHFPIQRAVQTFDPNAGVFDPNDPGYNFVNLRGAALPALNIGQEIGQGVPQTFSLLQFTAIGSSADMPFVVSLAGSMSFADADPLDAVVGIGNAQSIAAPPNSVQTTFDVEPAPAGSTISGTKFNDLNGDGTRDGGEPGLGGVTIQLDLGNDGTVDRTTVTNPDGTYSFADVSPGTHLIREVVPTGFVPTTPVEHLVTTQSGVDVANRDFGNFATVSLSGTKFNDLNGDGTRGGAEPGLAGVTIELDLGNDGTIDRTTVTDQNGAYSFADVGPGTHAIREVVPAGFIPTTPVEHLVTTQSGTNVVNRDFGNFATVTLSGIKFNDLNGDGTRGGAEPGLAGVTIQLDLGNDGTIDRTTVTGPNGAYSFANVGPGTHAIREVVPAGFVKTSPLADAHIVTTQSGTDVVNRDFGNFATVPLSGTKFNDLNGDGTRGGAEPGLAGVTIQLDLGNDGTIDRTTVTGPNGAYSFADVGPGTHAIREVVPAGFVKTSPLADAHIVTTQSGVAVVNRDFGNFATVSLSGTKFNDLNGDGTRGGAEPGLAGVTIQLDLGNDGTVDRTTVTGPNGAYRFADVGPGTHAIREVVPAGFVKTSPLADAHIVTTQSGTDVVNRDFGNFATVTLSGIKFNDLNANGIRDGNEPGLAGVTIQLDLGNDGTADRTTVTGADGAYSFADVGPGTHAIREIVPAGFAPTTAPHVVTLQSGLNVADLHFGNRALERSSSLSGFVFADTNLDGVFDANEIGLPNVTVTLNAADGATRQVLTGPDGWYHFENLPPGVYSITETQPASFVDASITRGTVFPSNESRGTTVGLNQFTQIQLQEGDVGVDYNFGNNLRAVTKRMYLTSVDPRQELCERMGLTCVTVRATDGNDQIRFEVEPDLLRVTVNNEPPREFLRADVDLVIIDGRGGVDEIAMVGSDADEVAHLLPGQAAFSSSDYGVLAVNVERTHVDARGGNDLVVFRDSQGADALRVTATGAELETELNLIARAVAFERLRAVSLPDGRTDTAQVDAAIELVGDWVTI